MLYLILLLIWLSLVQALIKPFLTVATYSDELLVAVCIVRFAWLNLKYRSCQRHLQGTKVLLFITALWMLMHIPLFGIPLYNGIVQTMIYFKFSIVFLWFAHEPFTGKQRQLFINNAKTFIMLVFIFLVVEFALGATYYNFFEYKPIDRADSIRRIALFSNPNHLGQLGGLMLLSGCLMAATRISHFKYRISKPIPYLLIFGAIFVFFSLARQPYVGLLFALGLSIIRMSFSRKIKISMLIVCVLGGILVCAPRKILWLVNRTTAVFTYKADTYLRNMQFFSSLRIATTHFPMGFGPGTYLSLMSVKGYLSPVYQNYGSAVATRCKVFVNYQEDRHISGIFDNNIASLLAEGGFIGLLLFVAMLLSISYQGYKKGKSFEAFVGFATPLYMLAVMYTSPVLTTATQVVFFGALAGFSLNKSTVLPRRSSYTIRVNDEKER